MEFARDFVKRWLSERGLGDPADDTPMGAEVIALLERAVGNEIDVHVDCANGTTVGELIQKVAEALDQTDE